MSCQSVEFVRMALAMPDCSSEVSGIDAVGKHKQKI